MTTRTFSILALALGLFAPVPTHAAPAGSSQAGQRTRQRRDAARQRALIAQAIKHHQAIYFITPYTPTGSHIPQVVCRYEGHDSINNSFTTGRVYGTGDLGLTGALTVGGALQTLDPAITTR